MLVRGLWTVFGLAALGVVGAVIQLAARDYLRGRFPSFAAWANSGVGHLARLATICFAMLLLSAAFLFLATGESSKDNRVALVVMAAIPPLIALSQIWGYRRDPERFYRR